MSPRGCYKLTPKIKSMTTLGCISIEKTTKYAMLALKIANDGEGGILALMALLAAKQHVRPTVTVI